MTIFELLRAYNSLLGPFNLRMEQDAIVIEIKNASDDSYTHAELISWGAVDLIHDPVAYLNSILRQHIDEE